MKKTKFRKVLATFMALAMLMTIALSISTVSAATDGTDVTIHKIKMDSFDGYPKENPNGSQLVVGDMGNDAVELAGVKFNYYRVDGSALYEYGAIKDAPLSAVPEATLASAVGVVPMGSFVTTATGFTINNLADGRYVFYEDVENGMVSASMAVPFVLNLPYVSMDTSVDPAVPIYDEGGNVVYLESIHVYPKNQTQEPVPTKHVRELGNIYDSEAMGDNLLYILTTTIPATIAEYDQFNFVDVIDSRLDYTGNLAVKLDGVALTGSAVAALPAGYFDIAGNDYYAILPPTTGGGTLTVAFTQAGLNKLAADLDKSATSLQVSYNTTINETADFMYTADDPMDDEIMNDFDILYINSYSNPTTPGPVKTVTSNKVYVYCGGETFVKSNDYTIDNDNIRYLAGAQFTLYEGEPNTGTIVRWTQQLVDQMNPTTATFVDEGSDDIWVGDPIIFISGSDGQFEIRGLAAYVDGKDGTNGKYYLEETLAPIGYIKLNVPIAFTIYKDSHDEFRTTDSTIQIKNAEMPDLPMTGGIGTIVFLVGGLLIMGGAVVTLRRKDRLER